MTNVHEPILSFQHRLNVGCDDDFVQCFDQTLSSYIAALRVVSPKAASLMPAQRALLLVAPKPSSALAYATLHRALEKIDEDFGGGFMRLFDAAIDPPIESAENIDLENLQGPLKGLALQLRDIAKKLSVLDDIGHALGKRVDLSSAAMVTASLVDFLSPSAAQLSGWANERGIDPRLLALTELAGERLSEAAIEFAKSVRCERAYALTCLTETSRHDDSMLDALLEAANIDAKRARVLIRFLS